MSLKVFLLFLPTSEGRSKYFSCCFITWTQNFLLISSWTSLEVLLLKNKDVLAWFSCWPEACSYTFSTCYNDSHSAREALQNIKLSLAKKRWESFFLFWFAKNPIVNWNEPGHLKKEKKKGRDAHCNSWQKLPGCKQCILLLIF